MSKYIYYDPSFSTNYWEQRVQWERLSPKLHSLYIDPLNEKPMHYSVPVNPLEGKKLEDYL